MSTEQSKVQNLIDLIKKIAQQEISKSNKNIEQVIYGSIESINENSSYNVLLAGTTDQIYKNLYNKSGSELSVGDSVTIKAKDGNVGNGYIAIKNGAFNNSGGGGGTSAVSSVNGKTGEVTLTKTDIGLSNVDNIKQYSSSNPPPYPVTSVNGQTGAVSITIPTAPTKTSDLTNDSDFQTGTEVESAITTASNALQEQITTNDTDISELQTNKADLSAVPTNTSDLTNDSNFITNAVNDLTNYYNITNSYNKAEVNSLLENVTSLNFEVVATLPTENISTTTIYLTPSTNSSTNNSYDEYVYINSTWELIGSTAIDLSNYLQNDGDSSNLTATFIQAENIENINTGETLSTIFSKIKKWIASLATVATSGSYNDLSDKPIDNGVMTSSLAIQNGSMTANYTSLSTNGNIVAGASTKTSYSMLGTTRKCANDSNAVNTSTFFTNSDGRSKFCHKYGDTTGNDDAFMVFNAMGFKIAYSGTKGTNATEEYTVLDTNNGYTSEQIDSMLNLDGLSDVTLATPTNGQILQYNGTNWINADNSGGGGSSTWSGTQAEYDALTTIDPDTYYYITDVLVEGQSVSYNNSESGLLASNTQDAIDELKETCDILSNTTEVFIAIYGTTTSAEIESAYQAGKAIFCRYDIYNIPLTIRSNSTTHIFTLFQNTAGLSRFIFCINNAWTNSTNTFLPKAGGVMTGVLTAQSNTAYSTKQVRNIIVSENDADLSLMGNGDIWIKV